MEDRPADLRAPLRGVRGVVPAGEVVLADRPVNGQRVLGDVGGQRTVGPVDAVVRAGVDDGGELPGRDDQRRHPAHGPQWPGAGHEDRGLAQSVGEQLGRVDAAARAVGALVLGVDRGVELAERALVPRPRVLDVQRLTDRGGRGGVHPQAADVGQFGRRRAGQQIAQRGDRVLRAGQPFFQPVQMGGDELVARLDVRRGQDLLDLLDRHVQIPEPPDDLRGRYLVGGVPAVARVRIHIGGLQQADPVVVAQRLHAQMGRAGEVADRQAVLHDPSLHPPLGGESRPVCGVDHPLAAAVRVVDVRPRGPGHRRRRTPCTPPS